MRAMYFFNKNDQLNAIWDDVDSVPVAEIARFGRIAAESQGHTAITDKGRMVCEVCRLDLGEIEKPAGWIEHGRCQKHNGQTKKED